MKRSALLVLLALTACGEPSITVRFVVPAAYRANVDGTALSIYEPPQAAPFSCDDVAFNEVGDEILRASRVATIDEQEGEITPLSDIDRLAPKVLVAEGFATGERVVVGCVEVGEIADDETIEIQAQPTTRTGTVAESIQAPLNATLADPVTITVTDFRGERLGGADVRWQVIGPGGPSDIGRATSDGDGRVSIAPDLPGIAGPFVLEVRVRWAEQAPEPIPGFVVPNAEVMELSGRIFDVRSGHVGPNGEPGFVALAGTDILGSRRLIFVYRASSGGELLTRVGQSVPAVSAALGLLDVPGEDRDRAIMVTDDAWYEYTTDGQPLRSDAYEPPPRARGAAPLSIHPAGGCPVPSTGPSVVISYDAEDAGIYEQNGLLTIAFNQRIEALAGGCVTDEKGTPTRMLVLNQRDIGLVVAAELTPAQFAVREWFAVPSGMSFARVDARTSVLLGTQLVVNDFVVSRLTIQRTMADQFDLVMQGLDSPPAPPTRNRGGKIDDDELLDVVSLFTRPRFVGEPARYALWAALGVEHRGRRIAGDFDLPQPELIAPEMMLLDLDQNAKDDVVIVERSAFDLLATTARVEIYSMGLTVR